MTIIEVENLRKEYRINKKKEGLSGAVLNLFNPKYEIKEAVKDINFSIEKGEMVGYIGANGAGKSTTIKMLTGILTPTSGKVTVNGLVPYKERTKNNLNIGVVFGQRTQLWWDIPVIESYKLIQKIYEIPTNRYKENLKFYTEYLDLGDLLKTPVRQLSLGQKMRCEITAAFIHDPNIVYLDEPTIGLDFMVKEKIREFIKLINKEKNITVIMTTHDLQDIEKVCNRIIIIDKGLIIYDGSLNEIKNRFSEYSTVNFQLLSEKIELNDILNHNFEKFNILSKEQNSLNIRFNRNKTTISDIINTISPYCEIHDLSINETSIETIVKDLYSQNTKSGVDL